MSSVKRTWNIEEKVAILKDIKETGVVEGVVSMVFMQ